jgi:hypothetical protein
MALDGDTPERAYPYWAGWRVVGCLVFFFSILGGAGLFLLPLGYEKVRNDELPVGIALIIIGLFGLPLLFLALLSLIGGIRDTINPPLLRVTTTSLILPTNLREDSTEEELDERGEPKDPNQPPAHPEEIPFSAIRWIRREGPPNPGSDKLMIAHDLSQQTLVIEQPLMHAADFDELETVLRAALPKAFANAPPAQS